VIANFAVNVLVVTRSGRLSVGRNLLNTGVATE